MGSRVLIIAAGVCVSVAALPGQNTAAVEAMMEAGHWKRVRQIATARIQTNPTDPVGHAWLAKVRITFGENSGAIAEAERAVSLEPRNAAYQGHLAEACAMMADRSTPIRGLFFVRCMKKAIDASRAADPRHIDTMLVEMMFTWKAPSVVGGDRKKAQRIADTIQSISPVWGYLAHARLLQDSGDDRTTENLLLNAVKADPSFYRARAALARFYCCTAKMRRMADAEKVAREALALDPSAAPGHEILARVLAAGQRWSDLEAALARAESAVPDDLTPYYGAAQSLIETGQDFRRAEKYLNRYLGQPPEGREPTHAEARWLLAILYEKEGKKADALRELAAAVQLDPLFEAAKRDLKRLKKA